MNELEPVHLKVACRHIRHKMMYIDERHRVPGMVDDSSDTRVFFCARTQEALGPDDASVNPTACTPHRSCYCDGAAAPS